MPVLLRSIMARLCLSESVVFVSYAAIGLIFIFFTDLGVFYVASVWGGGFNLEVQHRP